MVFTWQYPLGVEMEKKKMTYRSVNETYALIAGEHQRLIATGSMTNDVFATYAALMAERVTPEMYEKGYKKGIEEGFYEREFR